ncbi:MAG: glycosidase [Pseudomonadota bacterium]
MPADRTDFLIFTPDDVDLSASPLRASIAEETYVLGAFNPGFTRLPNGNLLMMVRIAEALREPVRNDSAHAIRWTSEGYRIDAYAMAQVDMRDPRQFVCRAHHYKTLALTSLSWLLPVELSPDGAEIVKTHYTHAIAPTENYQQYGVEDARISRIDGRYYMTTCSVSAERHCTTLYVSDDGIAYKLLGIILDHQNKDMLLFEGKVGDYYMAQTRPLGELYFAYPHDSEYLPGPCIQLARSPDLLHWKPLDRPGIRARKANGHIAKLGGGSPPIRTDDGWLTLFHGVEMSGAVGVYRTYWALLDHEDPSRILRLQDETPILLPRPDLTAPIAHQVYLSDIVFTTGLIAHEDHYIAASGEADLACRITHLPKALFA